MTFPESMPTARLRWVSALSPVAVLAVANLVEGSHGSH
jgi:hypothetical protein